MNECKNWLFSEKEEQIPQDVPVQEQHGFSLSDSDNDNLIEIFSLNCLRVPLYKLKTKGHL